MKKSKNLIVLIICIAAAAVVIAIGAILMSGRTYNKEHIDLNEYYSVSDNEAVVFLNGEKLEEKGTVSETTVYIPYDVISSTPGNPFYFESSTGKLYLTLQNENFIWTKDANPEVLTTSSDGVCVSADIVSKYSDISVETYLEPARILIRSEFSDIENATVTESSALRAEGNKKSEITKELLKDDKIYILNTENEYKGWVYAQTTDGITGYIEEKHISLNEPENITHETNTITTFDKITLSNKASIVWTYVDCDENNAEIASLLEGSSNIGIVCPTWISLADNEGNISSLADMSYAAYVKSLGMKLWVMVSDYYGDETTTGEILSKESARQNIIQSLISQSLEYGFDGINIDFETIDDTEAPAFLQFLRELSIETHRYGIVLSVDNYVPGYTDHYNRTEQAKIVDYIVIMGYDEHTTNSEEPGSVASLPFVEQAIVDTMEEVPSEQIILGVPFYTRAWTEPVGTTYFETTAVSMDAANEFVSEHGIKLSWNEVTGQYYGSANDGSANYSIWIEDSRSLAEKLKLIDKYGLFGAAAWRLGYENLSIWDVWGEYLPSGSDMS